jgi:hypothetical protein
MSARDIDQFARAHGFPELDDECEGESCGFAVLACQHGFVVGREGQ